MPRSKSNPLSALTVADLKALLAEKEMEDLKARQAALEADLRRVEKELARLVKGAAVATPTPKRAKRAAAKPGGKKADATKLPATGSIESVVINLLKANGAPMAFQDVLATIKKKKLVKTKAANFAGVLRQAMYKSSRIKRVKRGVYRA